MVASVELDEVTIPFSVVDDEPCVVGIVKDICVVSLPEKLCVVDVMPVPESVRFMSW